MRDPKTPFADTLREVQEEVQEGSRAALMKGRSCPASVNLSRGLLTRVGLIPTHDHSLSPYGERHGSTSPKAGLALLETLLGQGRGTWPEHALSLKWTCQALPDLSLTPVPSVLKLLRCTC